MATSLTLTALDASERLSQNVRTACRIIDGKAVVITIDENQVHVLNAVGTRVWQLADGRSLDAIIDQVVAEFEVERERAALDVCRFAAELVVVGAARISGPGDSTPGDTAPVRA